MSWFVSSLFRLEAKYLSKPANILVSLAGKTSGRRKKIQARGVCQAG